MVDRPVSQSNFPSVFEGAAQLASHALYSCVEAPITGAYQLVNHLSGERLPQWQIERPSGNSMWAQAGDLLGSAALFVGASKLSAAGLGKIGLQETADSTLVGAASKAALSSFVAGSAVGFLQPVDNKQGFWSTKLKTTGESGVMLAAMGGTARALDAGGWFGVAGNRTLAQSISLNSLAGGAGGLAGGLTAGAESGRLDFNDLANNTAHYALFGAAFGTVDWAAPHVVSATSDGIARLRAARNPGTVMPESLAMRMPAPGEPGDQGTLSHEVAFDPVNAALARPLPDFSDAAEQTFPERAPMMPQAMNQSQRYIKEGVVDSNFVPGVKLATAVESAGLDEMGTPLVRSDKYLVYDPLHDEVLDTTLNDAEARFTGIADRKQLCTAISKYVATIFNRDHVTGPELEQRYEQALKRASGSTVPLGEFIRQGTGVCLPEAALFKAIGERMGLNVRLFEGTVDVGSLQPHVWADVEMENGQHLIYDPAQQNNGALEYARPKSRAY